jgi:hypothetical protein
MWKEMSYQERYEYKKLADADRLKYKKEKYSFKY